jgi:parvulin-like peptidyl-prolyl isomerase
MARRRGPSFTSRKHLARAQREQLITRYLTIGTVVILGLVVVLIGYGVVSENFITPRQPVAEVNGVTIFVGDLETRVKYNRQTLVNQYIGTFNQVSQFAGQPQLIGFFTEQLTQIELQLDNTTFLGQEALNNLIDEEVVRQKAEEMGISLSEEEIDIAVEEAFGFFAAGTPVPTATLPPLPTATLSAEQLALVSPTPSPTIAPTSTPDAEATATPAESEENAEPTPTLAPTLVPTEFTRELFETNRQQIIDSYDQAIGFGGDELRDLITIQEIQRRIFEEVTADLPTEEEQVWARHILVEDQETAEEVLERLADGDDWSELTAEYSTDESNKNRGGDLGWFGSGRMVEPFETTAFALEFGEISEPVETTFGWHIIQLLGRENRSLSAAELQTRQAQEYESWLAEVRTSAEIEIFDIWTQYVPTEPTIPPQVRAQVQQLVQPQFMGTPVVPDDVEPETESEEE